MKNNSLIELKLEEQININGGRPDKTTSFWYDLAYYTAAGVKAFLTHDPGDAYMCM